MSRWATVIDGSQKWWRQRAPLRAETNGLAHNCIRPIFWHLRYQPHIPHHALLLQPNTLFHPLSKSTFNFHQPNTRLSQLDTRSKIWAIHSSRSSCRLLKWRLTYNTSKTQPDAIFWPPFFMSWGTWWITREVHKKEPPWLWLGGSGPQSLGLKSVSEDDYNCS